MKITIDDEEREINSEKLDKIYEEVKEDIMRKIDYAEENNDAQYILFALACYSDVSRRLFEMVLRKNSKEAVFDVMTK